MPKLLLLLWLMLERTRGGDELGTYDRIVCLLRNRTRNPHINEIGGTPPLSMNASCVSREFSW
jgi:hypothetical protein